MNTATTISKDVHNVSTSWKGKFHFESLADGHSIHLDKGTEHGGDGTGPTPKPLILSAIGGCTGMEIISILDKMRVHIHQLNIDVTGELTDTHPKIYKSVDVIFNIGGEERDKSKIEKAIQLAWEKYCGVIAMVKKFAEATYEIKYIT
ncbi:MAG: OsmC family protein [Bacteroidia bacterium]